MWPASTGRGNPGNTRVCLVQAARVIADDRAMSWRDHITARMSRRVHLVPMTPLEQLRAGRLPRRLTQLTVGLLLFGASMALLLQAGLGLEPWGVLHYGLLTYLPLSYGVISIVVSALVLLLWIPLRQWPGVGTVLNAIVIGLAIDATLAVTSAPTSWAWRIVALVVAIVGNGIAGALYIGSQLGPGPRDGLMTGLVLRTGQPIFLVRTVLEVSVVAIGWLLGGVVGVGTVVYALAIGPLVHAFLPLLTVDVSPPQPPASAVDGERAG